MWNTSKLQILQKSIFYINLHGFHHNWMSPRETKKYDNRVLFELKNSSKDYIIWSCVLENRCSFSYWSLYANGMLMNVINMPRWIYLGNELTREFYFFLLILSKYISFCCMSLCDGWEYWFGILLTHECRNWCACQQNIEFSQTSSISV